MVTPQLVEARHRGKEAIQEEIQSSIKNRIAHEPSYRRWTDAFSMTSNTWSTPEGWTDDTKAGQCFNHWYGLFHPDWLDGWYEEGDGSPEDWAAGVAALRRVSRASILACQGVWSTAGALWNNRISQDQNAISSSSVSARIAIMHSQAAKLRKTFLEDRSPTALPQSPCCLFSLSLVTFTSHSVTYHPLPCPPPKGSKN